MASELYAKWINHPFDNDMSDETNEYLKFVDDNDAWFYKVHNSGKSILEYLVSNRAPFMLQNVKSNYPNAFQSLKSLDDSIKLASSSYIRDQLLNILIDNRNPLADKLKVAENEDNVDAVDSLLDQGAPVDVDDYIKRKTNVAIYKKYLDLGYINENHIFDFIYNKESTECALQLIKACERKGIDLSSYEKRFTLDGEQYMYYLPIYEAVSHSNCALVKALFNAKTSYNAVGIIEDGERVFSDKENIMELAIRNVLEKKPDAFEIYSLLIKSVPTNKLIELEGGMEQSFMHLVISNNMTDCTLLLLEKIGIGDVEPELSSYIIANHNTRLFDKLYEYFMDRNGAIDLCIDNTHKDFFVKMVQLLESEWDHVRILYNNPPIDYIYLTLRLWDLESLENLSDEFDVENLLNQYDDKKMALVWFFLQNKIKFKDRKHFSAKVKAMDIRILGECSKNNDMLLKSVEVKPIFKSTPMRLKF